MQSRNGASTDSSLLEKCYLVADVAPMVIRHIVRVPHLMSAPTAHRTKPRLRSKFQAPPLRGLKGGGRVRRRAAELRSEKRCTASLLLFCFLLVLFGLPAELLFLDLFATHTQNYYIGRNIASISQFIEETFRKMNFGRPIAKNM